MNLNFEIFVLLFLQNPPNQLNYGNMNLKRHQNSLFIAVRSQEQCLRN